MAGKGFAPKPPEQVRRRNANSPVKIVEDDGQIHGPDLPERGWWMDGEGLQEWPPETAAWWMTWRRSAQAQTFTDTDWSFLLDTAILHAEFWTGDRSVAAELRLRAAKFGATPEDRARLKIEIGKPPERTEPRKRQAGRRERLLRAVGDDD